MQSQFLRGAHADAIDEMADDTSVETLASIEHVGLTTLRSANAKQFVTNVPGRFSYASETLTSVIKVVHPSEA